MIRTRDALMKLVEAGGSIRCELLHEPEPKTVWTDAASGEVVHASAVKWALREKRLQPLSDGLFADVAQTYVLAS